MCLGFFPWLCKSIMHILNSWCFPIFCYVLYLFSWHSVDFCQDLVSCDVNHTVLYGCYVLSVCVLSLYLCLAALYCPVTQLKVDGSLCVCMFSLVMHGGCVLMHALGII